MDPRRRRAVLLATLPAILTGAFLALSRHASSYGSPIVLGFWIMFVLCCLILAMRDIIALKREGNPH